MHRNEFDRARAQALVSEGTTALQSNNPKGVTALADFCDGLNSAQQQKVRELAFPVRMHGPALLAGIEDPHAELLALVWGPRFDRLHARDLLTRQPAVAPGALQAVVDAADQFDGLCATQQHRVRQLILRHRGGWDKVLCPPPPDRRRRATGAVTGGLLQAL